MLWLLENAFVCILHPRVLLTHNFLRIVGTQLLASVKWCLISIHAFLLEQWWRTRLECLGIFCSRGISSIVTEGTTLGAGKGRRIYGLLFGRIGMLFLSYRTGTGWTLSSSKEVVAESIRPPNWNLQMSHTVGTPSRPEKWFVPTTDIWVGLTCGTSFGWLYSTASKQLPTVTNGGKSVSGDWLMGPLLMRTSAGGLSTQQDALTSNLCLLCIKLWFITALTLLAHGVHWPSGNPRPFENWNKHHPPLLLHIQSLCCQKLLLQAKLNTSSLFWPKPSFGKTRSDAEKWNLTQEQTRGVSFAWSRAEKTRSQNGLAQGVVFFHYVTWRPNESRTRTASESIMNLGSWISWLDRKSYPDKLSCPEVLCIFIHVATSFDFLFVLLHKYRVNISLFFWTYVWIPPRLR